MRTKTPFIVEILTAIALIAAPFVLPYLGFTPNTINRIIIWGLFGLGFDILFGYTGLASLVCAKAGAKVTHVDASKKAIGFAKDNQQTAGLGEAPIRWICDDALTFVKRELRRGRRYDGIILDPPKFGRGPDGETWKLESDLPELLDACQTLLRTDPNDREDMFDGQFEQGPSLGDNFNMTHPQFQLVAKLNNFRRLYAPLQTGSHANKWYDPTGPGLFAYARRLGTHDAC